MKKVMLLVLLLFAAQIVVAQAEVSHQWDQLRGFRSCAPGQLLTGFSNVASDRGAPICITLYDPWVVFIDEIYNNYVVHEGDANITGQFIANETIVNATGVYLPDGTWLNGSTSVDEVFTELSGICTEGKVVRGIDEEGNFICVDPPTTLIESTVNVTNALIINNTFLINATGIYVNNTLIIQDTGDTTIIDNSLNITREVIINGTIVINESGIFVNNTQLFIVEGDTTIIDNSLNITEQLFVNNTIVINSSGIFINGTTLIINETGIIFADGTVFNGTLKWGNISGFPTACSNGQVVRGVNEDGTFVCVNAAVMSEHVVCGPSWLPLDKQLANPGIQGTDHVFPLPNDVPEDGHEVLIFVPQPDAGPPTVDVYTMEDNTKFGLTNSFPGSVWVPVTSERKVYVTNSVNAVQLKGVRTNEHCTLTPGAVGAATNVQTYCPDWIPLLASITSGAAVSGGVEYDLTTIDGFPDDTIELLFSVPQPLESLAPLTVTTADGDTVYSKSLSFPTSQWIPVTTNKKITVKPAVARIDVFGVRTAALCGENMITIQGGGSGGDDTDWSISGSNVYKATGTVAIGSDAADTGLLLDIEGKVGADFYCDKDGGNCKKITDLGSSTSTTNAGKWSDAPNGIHYSSGRVGIGVTDPAGALEVDSQIYVSGSEAAQYRVSPDGVNHWAAFGWAGTTKEIAQFDKVPDISVGADTGDIIFSTANGASIGKAERARILEANGNFGIGHAVPEARLHVANAGTSQLYLEGSQNGVGADVSEIAFLNDQATYPASDIIAKIVVEQDNTDVDSAKMLFQTATGSSNPLTRMAIDRRGFVGIGTPAPQNPLDIHSNIASQLAIRAVSGNTNAQIALVPSGTGEGVIKTGTNGNDLVFQVENTERMRIDDATGNVGIGKISPGEKLDVDGNVQADAFLYSSDASLKQNVSAVRTDDLLTLQGVEFDWRSSGKHDIGFIAQDVEKIYPELVATHSVTGKKSVDYAGLIPPLLEIVKAQQTQIDLLKQQVEELQQNE